MRFLTLLSSLILALSFQQVYARASEDLTVILSLRKGSAVADQDLQKILKNPRVEKYRDVFSGEEKNILKSIEAEYLGRSWVLTLKDEKSFDLLEKQIRRAALPMNLDWNNLGVASQEMSPGASTKLEPFESLQWGLHNAGDPQVIDLDPVMTFRTPGVALQDIHLAPTVVSPRKIRVAVLDTGINHTHPDLFSVIHRNESECRALDKYKACLKENEANKDADPKLCEKKWFDLTNPEVDQDHNGYPLDCSGWSLIGGINAANIMGRPDFEDSEGHGTHVAGIIGALQNGIGVRGVSNNIEILPIQVIGVAPNEPLRPLSVDLNPLETERQGRAANGLSDLVARGVIYAIRSGANVMNFSLGWPQGSDSQFMRSLIEEAQSRGIVIVAAAGNDSTRALLRPCAYPGVICVAAHGPDGALAHFSNYGSGVDIAAPGVNILSTYAMDKRPVHFRQTFGYEYRSGTSQAAPFVSGVVAEMLARGIPSSEIYPRLVLGSRPLLANQSLVEGASHIPGRVLPADRKPYEKYLLGGQMDMMNALSVKAQPLIVPFLKEKAVINWNRKSAELSWTISLQNRWLPVNANDVQLKTQFVKKTLQSIRPEVSSVLPIENKGGVWATGEVRKFEVKFKITDTNNVFNSRIPSDLELAVMVSAPMIQSRKLVFEGEIIVPVTADLNDPDVFQIPLVNMPKTRFDLVPVDENLDGAPAKRDYMLLAQQGTTAKYLLWLLTQKNPGQNSAYETVAGPKISIDGDIDNLRTQIQTRLDRNGQGQTQFVLGFYEDKSQTETPGPSPESFYFFDSAMKLVESFKYDSTLAQIPFTFSWQMISGSKMPAWVGYGKDPDKKRNLRDIWENPDNTERKQLRFYYLDTDKTLHAIQKYQDYLIVDTLLPRAEQMIQGRVPVLLAKNRGTVAKPSYLYDFATAEIINGKVENFMQMDFFAQAETYRNILDTRVDKVNSLDPQGSEFNGSFWFSEGELRTQRLSMFNSQTLEFLDQTLKAERSQFDSALWVRAAFDGKDRKGAFVLTNSEIQFHDLITGAVASTSFERYTFFPDSFQSNIYFPITLHDSKSSRAKLPGLFTTEDSQLNRGTKILTPLYGSDGKLAEIVSPARLRFSTGAGCRPLNTPVFMGEQGSAFDYYCGDRILRIPLNY